MASAAPAHSASTVRGMRVHAAASPAVSVAPPKAESASVGVMLRMPNITDRTTDANPSISKRTNTADLVVVEGGGVGFVEAAWTEVGTITSSILR